MLTIDRFEKIEFIEEISSELIFTTLFQDLGAPKGVTGMVDWRLNGFLSRTIVDKQVQGNFLETTLIPLEPPFVAQRLCVLGLGPWRQYNSLTLKKLLPKLLTTLIHLRPESCLVCIPRLLKESYKEETREILTQFFSALDVPCKIDIQITPIA